jgi:hypothetical protein
VHSGRTLSPSTQGQGFKSSLHWEEKMANMSGKAFKLVVDLEVLNPKFKIALKAASSSFFLNICLLKNSMKL